MAGPPARAAIVPAFGWGKAEATAINAIPKMTVGESMVDANAGL